MTYIRKIRIYPTKEHIQLFNNCFGTSRYFYNKTVDYVNGVYKKSKDGCIFDTDGKQCCNKCCDENSYYCEEHKDNKVSFSFINLRKQVMVNDSDLSKEDQWQKEVPYDVRQLVIKSFVGNYKSAISNYKNGNNNGFSMGHKSKKDRMQTFYVNKKAITSDLSIFKRRVKKKIRIRKKMKRWWDKNVDEIESNCVITRERPNKYYLCLTMNKKKTPTAATDVAALDPGVRTFQTFYSSSGKCGGLGNGFDKHIYKLGKKCDNLQSLVDKEKNGRHKCNLKKRYLKSMTKIKNVVNDLHWKVANYLCKNFKTILLPEFKTSLMTKGLKSKTVRNMMTLSHYAFSKKLEHKCNEYNVSLIRCKENHTSMTCGKCGILNRTLSGSKMFKCNSCKTVIDRDYNGARNILIKYISERL